MKGTLFLNWMIYWLALWHNINNITTIYYFAHWWNHNMKKLLTLWFRSLVQNAIVLVNVLLVWHVDKGLGSKSQIASSNPILTNICSFAVLQTFPFFGVVPAILNESGEELEGPSDGYLVRTITTTTFEKDPSLLVLLMCVDPILLPPPLNRYSNSRGPAWWERCTETSRGLKPSTSRSSLDTTWRETVRDQGDRKISLRVLLKLYIGAAFIPGCP